MSFVTTFMQAGATASLYNAQLARQYSDMGQMALLNHLPKLAPLQLGVKFGNAPSANAANTGDTFTRSTPHTGNKVKDSVFLAPPILTTAMDELAKVAQKSNGLALLTMFSSMWQQFYKVMLNALRQKPPEESPAKTPTK
jgi:hypothetical protein